MSLSFERYSRSIVNKTGRQFSQICLNAYSYSCIRGGINGTYCGGEDSNYGGNNTDDDPVFDDDTDPNGTDNIWGTSDEGLIPNDTDVKNSGNDSAISELNDITGQPRKVGTVDMGAYENQD